MKFENINEDCANVIMSFLWPNYTRQEFLTDLDYYVSWHRVPDIFLNCGIQNLQLDVRVPSPYRKNTPFVPRHIVRISPWSIWSPALKRFVYGISRHELENIQTLCNAVAI